MEIEISKINKEDLKEIEAPVVDEDCTETEMNDGGDFGSSLVWY